MIEKIGEIVFEDEWIIDVYNSEEEPMFRAMDISQLIDYSVGNTTWMLATVDECEKVLVNRKSNNQRGGNRKPEWFLTEDGLYEVLMRSSKPVAKRFKTTVKRILRDMRKQSGQNFDEWFGDITMEEDLDSLNALREDHGLEPFTMDEYLESRRRWM